MNTDTGEILRMKNILKDALTSGELEIINGSGDVEPVGIPDGFKPVPDDLTEEAEKVLQGRDRAFADLSKDTPLTRWARQDRESRATVNAHRDRNKKSMQKASKRRNRG